ncbi:hypothetical protein Hanom_Chr07g00658771 [Helianthus anomalus]
MFVNMLVCQQEVIMLELNQTKEILIKNTEDYDPVRIFMVGRITIMFLKIKNECRQPPEKRCNTLV